MANALHLQPVTRIRAEFEPAPQVKTAVNRFLEVPMKPGGVRMYTTAQAIVDQREFHDDQYHEVLRYIEQTTRSLAQHAFALAAPLKIQEFANGGGRLLFSVQNQPTLDDLSEKIHMIRSLEETSPENMLYVELARGSLAKDRGRRQDQLRTANGLIRAELNHPTARYRMTANQMRIVTRDMMYPLSERL